MKFLQRFLSGTNNETERKLLEAQVHVAQLEKELAEKSGFITVPSTPLSEPAPLQTDVVVFETADPLPEQTLVFCRIEPAAFSGGQALGGWIGDFAHAGKLSEDFFSGGLHQGGVQAVSQKEVSVLGETVGKLGRIRSITPERHQGADAVLGDRQSLDGHGVW